MRRLYSTFAGGWPGTGLLLVRVVSGITLIVRAGATLAGDTPMLDALPAALEVGSGVLLLAGLWTPIAGILVALTESSLLLTTDESALVCLLIGTMGAALAMLGPGLWSVDARLFGWRRVEAPPRRTTVR